MNEYISRDKVLKKFIEGDGHDDDRFTEGYNFAVQEHRKEVENIPAADVQPVIHAHWRRGEEKGFRTYNPLWYCSNCGGQIRYDTRMRQYQKMKRPVWEVNAFCRKCGARMDGDTECQDTE